MPVGSLWMLAPPMARMSSVVESDVPPARPHVDDLPLPPLGFAVRQTQQTAVIDFVNSVSRTVPHSIVVVPQVGHYLHHQFVHSHRNALTTVRQPRVMLLAGHLTQTMHLVGPALPQPIQPSHHGLRQVH